jgi:glycine oxidase
MAQPNTIRMTQKQRQADCLVIGGGLAGMLTAYFLNREGLAVDLLERGETCRESSWAGGGIISPLVPWQYPQAVSTLVRWSQQYYPGLADTLREETGIDIEWLQSGLLMLDVSPDRAIREWADGNSCVLQAVDAAQLAELEPAVGLAASESVLLPEVAQVRNPRLGAALRSSLSGRGVTIHEHTEVTGFIASGGRVRGVATTQGDFPAERVVIAGGAWSGPLLAMLDISLPVKPVRGQMIQYQAPPGLLRHIVLYRDHYLIPRRDGLLLAGSTLEDVGYDKSTTSAARDELMQKASQLVPALDGCEVVRHWSGLRPGVSDGVPFIGPHPACDGLFINTGHFRNGVVMAPASARLLADLLLGQDSFTDAAPYRP